ncbi:NAD(P)H-binding protein [Microbacterium sp. HA-8]|uniref:NAD(P)H-binding protein n=1 Tax=unclassified Microbacterium TaxID=2609290 RepID=UPI0018E23AA5|nr:NAD(P)H-binding protein [Microbacterium sp. BR1]
MSYLVHGATGAQGSPVAAELIAAGRPVTAISRTPGTDVPGAETVIADYASAEQLTEAYRDADGVFVHLPARS